MKEKTQSRIMTHDRYPRRMLLRQIILHRMRTLWKMDSMEMMKIATGRTKSPMRNQSTVWITNAKIIMSQFRTRRRNKANSRMRALRTRRS